MEKKKHRVLKLLTVGALISSVFTSAWSIKAQEPSELEDMILEEKGSKAAKEIFEAEQPKGKDTKGFLSHSEMLRDEVIVANGIWGTSKWTLDSKGTLNFEAGEFEASYVDEATGGIHRPNWFDDNQTKIIKIVFNGEVRANERSAYLFAHLPNLVSIENIQYLNTSNVENMFAMFSRDSSLTTLDLNDWETSNVTSMRSMFYACTNLKSLSIDNFNTSKVTVMNDMFSECSKIEFLDVSNFDTSKVINLEGTFRGCTSLTSFTMGNWDLTSATNMMALFQNCSSLNELNINISNSRSVENMFAMFSGMTNLQKITGLETLDTSTATNMGSMFYSNTNLMYLDLNKWNTDKVTNFANMFAKCSRLEVLKIGSWNTSNATNMAALFQESSNLKSLDLANWNTDKVTVINSMFGSCKSLASLDISGFNTTNIVNKSSMFAGCEALKSITLGAKTLISDTNLTNINGTNYTSRWIGLNTGVIYSTSVALMSDFDGGNPDTFVWEENLTIDFDTDGADAIASQNLTTTQTVAKPSDPIKTGYTFDGWYSDKEYTNKWDFTSQVIENKTLYAKYKIVPYMNDSETTTLDTTSTASSAVVTSDNTNLSSLATMFVVSILSILVVSLKRKKSSKK